MLAIECKTAYSDTEERLELSPLSSPFMLIFACLFIPSASFRGLIAACVLLLNACVAAETRGSVDAASGNENPADGSFSIQIEVLSMGRGVPHASMRAYQEIKTLVMRYKESGTHVVITELLLGLEGERRMCVVLTDTTQTDALYGEISELAHEMKLMRVSKEPCK